jgi:hypothetical protein
LGRAASAPGTVAVPIAEPDPAEQSPSLLKSTNGKYSGAFVASFPHPSIGGFVTTTAQSHAGSDLDPDSYKFATSGIHL